jgi:hypothetical protein
MMENVFIYGYICIGIVGLALLGLLVFSWIAIRRLTRLPRRWVPFVRRPCVRPNGVAQVVWIVSSNWKPFRGVP